MKAIVLFLSVGCVFAAGAMAAPVTCTADVRATPRSDEVHDQFVDKVFAVEIETKEPCAKVYVDFTTTERLFDGEVITSTTRGWRKVTTSTTYKTTYRIARDTDLLDAKFKVARCVVCGTE